MNDHELNELFDELATSYEAELDVQAGIHRLRAASHGFAEPAKNEPAEDEQWHGITASAITGSPKPQTPGHPPAETVAQEMDASMINGTIAVLEGLLVTDEVVQIDLSKLEGPPTGRALVVIHQGRGRAVTARAAEQQGPGMQPLVQTAVVFLLITIAAAVIAVTIAVLAYLLGVPPAAGFVTTVTGLGLASIGGALMVSRAVPHQPHDRGLAEGGTHSRSIHSRQEKLR